MGSGVSAPTNVDDTDNTVPNDYADKKSMVVATSLLPRIHSEAVKSPAISSDDHFASDIDHSLVHRALDMDQSSKVPLNGTCLSKHAVLYYHDHVVDREAVSAF